jgi:putative addiction module component (TIGR02574 family)
MGIQIEEILTLSVKQRLRLLEEVWESIAANPEQLPLTAAQRRELDRRRREHRKDPSAANPWSEVRVRLERRGRGTLALPRKLRVPFDREPTKFLD